MAIRKAVFPAAGLGTRFLPATKAQPKEMLPIVDKPTIQYVVEEAVASGIRDVVMVTGRGKEAIENHFDRSLELEMTLARKGRDDLREEVRRISDLVSFCYIRQKEPLGLGHAILVARELVGEEPFAVLLGDDIIDAPVPCLRQLIDLHARTGSSVLAVQRVPKDEVSSYGVIAGRPLGDGVSQVLDLVEKPDPRDTPSDLAIIGRYVLTPTLFPLLAETPPDRGGEIQLTDGLRALLRRETIHAVEFVGTRYDAGSKLGFLKATVEFALKRPDLAPSFREYLKRLDPDSPGASSLETGRGDRSR